MKWIMVFYMCTDVVCTYNVMDTRYETSEMCSIALQYTTPKDFFLSEVEGEFKGKYCMLEAELSHPTERVINDL